MHITCRCHTARRPKKARRGYRGSYSWRMLRGWGLQWLRSHGLLKAGGKERILYALKHDLIEREKTEAILLYKIQYRQMFHTFWLLAESMGGGSRDDCPAWVKSGFEKLREVAFALSLSSRFLRWNWKEGNCCPGCAEAEPTNCHEDSDAYVNQSAKEIYINI